MVLRLIPNKLLTFEEIGLPKICAGPVPPAARAVPGDRPDRVAARPPRWPR